MSNNFEIFSNKKEGHNESGMHNAEKLLIEYKTQLNEAEKNGNQERIKYLRSKIDGITDQKNTSKARKESFGSTPFSEVQKEQYKLDALKTELSKLEAKKDKSEDGKRAIAKKKLEIENQERVLVKTRQTSKPIPRVNTNYLFREDSGVQENQPNRAEERPVGKEQLKDSMESFGIDSFREIGRHQKLAMQYERMANELERKIQRGIEPKNKMSEVKRLRNRAASEKREVESAKRLAKQQLTNYRENSSTDLQRAKETEPEKDKENFDSDSISKSVNAERKYDFRGYQSRRSLETEAKVHENKANAYKRQANKAKAQGDYESARKYTQKASEEMRKVQRIVKEIRKNYGRSPDIVHTGTRGSESEISFGGGLGGKQIDHINGSFMISEANRKRTTASMYESDARRARSEGNFSKASSFDSMASSLRSEANSLEAKGKKLQSK